MLLLSAPPLHPPISLLLRQLLPPMLPSPRCLAPLRTTTLLLLLMLLLPLPLLHRPSTPLRRLAMLAASHVLASMTPSPPSPLLTRLNRAN